MELFRAIRRWWYFRYYGVCPDHLTLCERGGGYEPKWICRKCHEENRIKHEHGIADWSQKRIAACERLAKLERIR